MHALLCRYYAFLHGQDEAKKIIDNEKRAFDELVAFVKQYVYPQFLRQLSRSMILRYCSVLLHYSEICADPS